MKRESFFGNLFRSADTPADAKGPTQVVITAYSQPHVLNQRMKEEKLTHGETVTANLSPVRLENAYGRMVLYFCPMKTIEVLHTVSAGDGGSLPAEAKVEGLTVPDGLEGGYYTLKNVTLTSNGTMQVKATRETAWELVKPERY
jgi:hypothetical protein